MENPNSGKTTGPLGYQRTSTICQYTSGYILSMDLNRGLPEYQGNSLDNRLHSNKMGGTPEIGKHIKNGTIEPDLVFVRSSARRETCFGATTHAESSRGALPYVLCSQLTHTSLFAILYI